MQIPEPDVPDETSHRHNNRLTRDKKEALIRGAQDETQMRGLIVASKPGGGSVWQKLGPRKVSWKLGHVLMFIIRHQHAGLCNSRSDPSVMKLPV